MADVTTILTNLLPVIGQKGIDAVEGQLATLTAGADAGWKKASLALLANAVEQHGPAGIAMAQNAIHDLLDGKVPQIDWADLEVASDILAELQNAEADKKTAVRDFTTKISEVIGVIIKGFLSSLV